MSSVSGDMVQNFSFVNLKISLLFILLFTSAAYSNSTPNDNFEAANIFIYEMPDGTEDGTISKRNVLWYPQPVDTTIFETKSDYRMKRDLKGPNKQENNKEENRRTERYSSLDIPDLHTAGEIYPRGNKDFIGRTTGLKKYQKSDSDRRRKRSADLETAEQIFVPYYPRGIKDFIERNTRLKKYQKSDSDRRRKRSADLETAEQIFVPYYPRGIRGFLEKNFKLKRNQISDSNRRRRRYLELREQNLESVQPELMKKPTQFRDNNGKIKRNVKNEDEDLESAAQLFIPYYPKGIKRFYEDNSEYKRKSLPFFRSQTYNDN